MIAKGKTLVACMEFHCIQLVIRQQLKIDKQICRVDFTQELL